MLENKLIVIRGGGDIATGIACRLFNSGFRVILLEIEKPSAIRRKVSFSQAVYEKKVFVQGICGKLAANVEEALIMTENNFIPVIIDESLNSLNKITGDIVVDVDAVVETQRGHHLGEVIFNGSAQPNTGIPGNIGGYGIERVIKAPNEGLF